MGDSRVLLLARGLLRAFPLLAIRPGTAAGVTIEGELSFNRTLSSYPTPICDAFVVRMLFPEDYPKRIPDVWETGGRIARNPDHHVNPDGQLCLGNPLRIRLAVLEDPTALAFVERLVIPYLCGTSVRLATGKYPQGELGHGEKGLLEDGMEFFGLKDEDGVRDALRALAERKSVADKLACPCRCGRRLGHCQFGMRVDALRLRLGRDWVRDYRTRYMIPGSAKGLRSAVPAQDAR